MGEKAERRIKSAAKTNLHRDKHERKLGFAAPGDSGMLSYLRNVDSALTCGLELDDWDAVAEGTAMLRDIISRLTVPSPKLRLAPRKAWKNQ